MFSMNEQKAIELGEAGEKAIREQNEYNALQNVEYLREFGKELLEANLETDLKRVVISLRNIGNKAIQKRMENVASTTIDVLKSSCRTCSGEKFLKRPLVFFKSRTGNRKRSGTVPDA